MVFNKHIIRGIFDIHIFVFYIASVNSITLISLVHAHWNSTKIFGIKGVSAWLPYRVDCLVIRLVVSRNIMPARDRQADRQTVRIALRVAYRALHIISCLRYAGAR